jgi:CRISPR-associated endonuclease/helicase Cas3
MWFPDYDTLFRTALRASEAPPHDFQRRFAQAPKLYDLIRAPTGSGKTEAILLGWAYRRFGPDDAVRRATPRRLVYCLPMRTLVEQTRDRAVRYLHNLGLLAGRAEFDPTDPMPVGV